MKAISSAIIVLAGAVAIGQAGSAQGLGPFVIGGVGIALLVPGFLHWQREMRRSE